MLKRDNFPLRSYKNKNILITGSSGYIGSNLVRVLEAAECQIILLVRNVQRAKHCLNTMANISIIRGDISSRETWSKALEGIDYIFHLAAQTNAYTANKDPLTDFNINVLPVLHMLEICRTRRLSTKIVFAGTVTEVGITLQTPVDETFPDSPSTIYDIHKFTAEKYLQYYTLQTTIKTVTLRLSNVYGPGPSSSCVGRGVLNRMIDRALRGETLKVYGEGTFVRDYVFIDDVVRAFLIASSKIDVLNGNYYVIGSGVGIRLVNAVNLIADRVARKKGYRPSVVHITPPDDQLAIEGRNFVANTTRFTKATNWTPEVSLEKGIDYTVEYFLGKEDKLQEIF